jgi:biotin transport system substrate-specific component
VGERMNKNIIGNSRTHKMILCALFIALTAIGAFIKIPTPIAPFSLQVLFVIMAGLILGSKLGFFSQVAYILIGLIGIPIFALGGGLSYIFQPTFGFLLGFPIAAFIIGKIVEKSKPISYRKLIMASTAGLVSIYAIGLPYLYFIVNIYMGKEMPISSVIWSACIIFLPGDIIKILIASFLALKIVRTLNNYSV